MTLLNTLLVFLAAGWVIFLFATTVVLFLWEGERLRFIFALAQTFTYTPFVSFLIKNVIESNNSNWVDGLIAALRNFSTCVTGWKCKQCEIN